MKSHVIVVGMGQLGALLSEGLLKSGRGVTPVLRDDDVESICKQMDPEAVLVATGEDDLDGVLGALPHLVRDRVILIQNELRPDQWQRHDIDPTVGIVWFEKKKGKLPAEVLPSVLFGRHAPLLGAAIDRIDLHHRTIDTPRELAHELVLKNLYILALNLAGLRGPGTALDLLGSHRQSFERVLSELLPFETAMLTSVPSFSGVRLDESRLRRDLEGAILADPGHGCSGRSAPRRLARTLEQARRIGIKTPFLEELAASIS